MSNTNRTVVSGDRDFDSDPLAHFQLEDLAILIHVQIMRCALEIEADVTEGGCAQLAANWLANIWYAVIVVSRLLCSYSTSTQSTISSLLPTVVRMGRQRKRLLRQR